MTMVARHEQIAAELRKSIVAGEWPVGDRLPPLQDLADQHEVSVSTVRVAQRALAREGLLLVVHGRGAYVMGVEPERVDPVAALRDAAAAIEEARVALADTHGRGSAAVESSELQVDDLTGDELDLLCRALTDYAGSLRRRARDTWAGDDMRDEADAADRLATQFGAKMTALALRGSQ